MLQIGNNLKQIARLRVSTRTKHPHQAFRGAMRNVAQFGKSNRCIDEIAKNDLAGFHVTREKVFNSFAEKRLAKPRIALYARPYRFLEITCQSHCGKPSLTATIG